MVAENWNRLFNFWNKINFNDIERFDYENRIRIGDTLVYTEEDEQKLKKLISVNREFSPASLDEILKLEEVLNIKLPISFKESLQINDKDIIENHNFYPWLGGWNQLFSCKDIINHELELQKYRWFCKNGSFEYIFGDVENPKYSEPKEWIPICNWNGDYIIAIDMLSKNKGQIIVYSNEDSIVSKWTDSYEDWFKVVVDEVLKYGELRVETIEKILHISE
jgi:cell wall assembly regulator SMI1